MRSLCTWQFQLLGQGLRDDPTDTAVTLSSALNLKPKACMFRGTIFLAHSFTPSSLSQVKGQLQFRAGRRYSKKFLGIQILRYLYFKAQNTNTGSRYYQNLLILAVRSQQRSQYHHVSTACTTYVMLGVLSKIFVCLFLHFQATTLIAGPYI